MKTKALFFLVLLILFAHLDVNAGQTFKEPLKIAIDKGYPPQTFLNLDGQPAGMFVDIWRLWSQKTGKEITFITGNWNDTLTDLTLAPACYENDRLGFFSWKQVGIFHFSMPTILTKAVYIQGQVHRPLLCRLLFRYRC